MWMKIRLFLIINILFLSSCSGDWIITPEPITPVPATETTAPIEFVLRADVERQAILPSATPQTCTASAPYPGNINLRDSDLKTTGKYAHDGDTFNISHDVIDKFIGVVVDGTIYYISIDYCKGD